MKQSRNLGPLIRPFLKIFTLDCCRPVPRPSSLPASSIPQADRMASLPHLSAIVV